MSLLYNSVTLDADKCMGCTNCIKRCPTEAIRVRDGKARIISERCIDCGECITACPYHAKRAIYDDVGRMNDFQYKIALPSPTLYGQFHNLDDIDYILTGLIGVGFDEVYEVSRSAEMLSDATRQMMKEQKFKKPVISSACPAVIRLIRIKFPDLCENVFPYLSPMQIAGRRAKEEAMKKTGLPAGQIGVFFITPCLAQVTDVHHPIGIEESWIDGAFSLAEIYPGLLDCMNKVQEPLPISKSGIIGVSWATSGGESSALIREQHLAVDGMENVMAVLEEIEGERMRELDFIELNACPGGCVGGVLTIENPYIAKARIQRIRKHLPVSLNRFDGDIESIKWKEKLKYIGVMKLSDDIGEAIRMMGEIDRITETLKGLDCGSCGAPSCRALAEDIVMGKATLDKCVFVLHKEPDSIGMIKPKDMS